MIGTERFGKYNLFDIVATGGMAEIFRAKYAEPTKSAIDLAIKRILPSYSEDEDFLVMFRDESAIATRLRHPNIVRVFDAGEFGQDCYMAMEYIHGKNLWELAAKCKMHNKRFTPSQVAFVGVKTLQALDYAHKLTDEQGIPMKIVHRDVTPHNVMIEYSGGIKLMDFGIAKAASKVSKTKIGTIKGKSSYMSPEQARGKELDGRSDMFTFAVVMWELLTGKRLFAATTDYDILRKVLKFNIPHPSDLDDKIPKTLGDIVMRALDRSRGGRFADCLAMATALDDFLKNEGDGSESQVGIVAMALFEEKGHTLAEIQDYVPGVASLQFEQVDEEEEPLAPKSSDAPSPIAISASLLGGAPAATPIYQGNSVMQNPPFQQNNMPYNQDMSPMMQGAPAGMPPSGQYGAPFGHPGFNRSGQFAQPGMIPQGPGFKKNNKSTGTFVIAAVIIALLLIGSVILNAIMWSKPAVSEEELAEAKAVAVPDAIFTVKTTPKGAKIFINGKEATSPSPVFSQPGAIGTEVEIKAVLKDHETVTVKRKILQQTQTFLINLVSTLPEKDFDNLVAQLTIDSTPSGSEISVNGKSIGKAPVVVKDLPLDEAVEIVAVSADKSFAELRQSYTPEETGELKLNLKHQKAAVAKAQDAPKAPAANKGSAGSRASGNKQKNVDHSGGKAKINIQAKPWGIVSLDGQKFGKAPTGAREVASGKHTVEITFPPQQKKVTKKLNLPKNSSTTVGYDFMKNAWY